MTSWQEELDRLADETWCETVDPPLARPWRHLRLQLEGNASTQKHEAKNLESRFKTEGNILEDYSGRYAIELLQNAHDAAAEAKLTSATVWIHISDGALIVGNQGRRFDEERLDGLLWLSSGTKRAADFEQQTIGYKGIGFTSVFEITDRPQILSGPFRFELDAIRARELAQHALERSLQGVPRRGFPFPLAPGALGTDARAIARMEREGAVTVIRLPFADNIDADEVGENVRQTVTQETLLLLPAITRLVITGHGPRREWRIRKRRGKHGGRVLDIENENRTKRSWLVFEGETRLGSDITSSLHQEVWQSATKVRAIVGVPWKAGRPDPTREEQAIHVYFPTADSTGRKILISGDFYVHTDRTRIHHRGSGGRVTDAVAEVVVELVGEIAEALSGYGEDLLRCLAPLGDVAGYGVTLNEAIDEELEARKFVRTAGDGRAAPEDLWALPAQVNDKDTVTITELLDDSSDFMHPLDRGDDETLDWLAELGLDRADWTEVVGRIDARRSGRPYDAVLSALDRLRRSLWYESDSRLLKDRYVLQDQKGTWITPSSAVRSAEGVPPLPSFAALSTVKMPRSPTARAFVSWLEIPVLDARRAAGRIIEVARRLPDEDEASWEKVLRFLRRLHREHAGKLRWVGGQGAIRVPCRALGRDQVALERADRAYFGSAWTNTELLEVLYGPFGKKEFLAHNPPKREKRSAKDFYKWLGVADAPRVETASQQVGRWALRTGWMLEAGLDEKDPCRGDHPNTRRQVQYQTIDRFEKLLGASRAARRALAGYLADSDGQDAQVTIECLHSSHRTVKEGRASGGTATMIASEPWLPAFDSRGHEIFRRPSECWVDLPTGKKLELARADVPRDVGLKLGCANGGHPSVASIASAFQRLESEHQDLDEADEIVRDTADWLLKRLQGALKAPYKGDPFPLPAFQGSTPSWSYKPLIADIDGLDRLETLEWINDEDGKLRRHLDLPLARDHVTIEVKTTGPEVLNDVMDHSWRIGVLCLIDSAVQDIRGVVSRLGRLEQVSTDRVELLLSYRGAAARSTPSVYLEGPGPRRGPSKRSRLYLANGWRGEPLLVARALADYLGLEAADKLFPYVKAPTETLKDYDVTEAQWAEAEAKLEHYRTIPTQADEPVSAEASAEESEIGGPEATEADDRVEQRPKEPSTAAAKRSPAAAPKPRVVGPWKTDEDRSRTDGKRKHRTTPTHGSAGNGRAKQRRLVTYVPPEGTPASVEEVEGKVHRTRSELAGIEAVKLHEQAAGRYPKMMPPGNEGYDIKSYASAAMSGDVARYIEVKSLYAAWDVTNVRVTGPQLSFGRGREADRWWLYVVEYAQTDRTVHAIPRAASRADGFYFDRGWRALAEEPTMTRESVLEEAVELFLEEVQPCLLELVRQGFPVPVTIEGPMGELTDFSQDWVVEAGWPEERIAIVMEPDESRDEYLRGAGWEVRDHRDWSVDELAELLNARSEDNE